MEDEIDVISNRVYNAIGTRTMHDIIGVLKGYAIEAEMMPVDFIKAVLMHVSKRIPQLGTFYDMLDLEKIPTSTDYSMLEDDTEQDHAVQQDEARSQNALNFWRKHITGYDDDDNKHEVIKQTQQQQPPDESMADSIQVLTNRFLKTITLKNRTLHDGLQSLANYAHNHSLTSSTWDAIYKNAVQAYPSLPAVSRLERVPIPTW